MPAYLIAEHTVTDVEKFEEYRVKVGPLIAKHGGRYITEGGSHTILEADNAVSGFRLRAFRGFVRGSPAPKQGLLGVQDRGLLP